MKRRIFASLLALSLIVTPFTAVDTIAKGPAWKQDQTTTSPGNGNNSKNTRTTEPVQQPVEEPVVEPIQSAPEPVVEEPVIQEPAPIEVESPVLEESDVVTYTVQAGDSLWKIASLYGITVEEIKAANNLTSDMIFIGQVLIIPIKSSPDPMPEEQANDFLVLGYYTKYWNTDVTSYYSLQNYHSFINSVAITTYQVNSDGMIEEMAAPEALQLAKEKGVKTYATIQNHFQPELTHTILSSPALRQTTINNIYQIVKDQGFDGVNIDFENMYATDRALFNQFIKEVSEFFSPLGYDLIVSAPAKTADNPTWAWSGTFDYAFLGQYAKLQLMTYDNSGTWSTPGPTAGIDWVENVLKYATSLVPAENLLIGLPAYGYEWNLTTGTGHRAVSLKVVDSIIEQTKPTIHFDLKSQTPYFHYTDANGHNRIIWYENEASINAKMNLVEKYNLGGVSIWRMGLENEVFWNTVNSRLK